MSAQTILNVPYEEKDRVKSLGAKFNGNLKKWYVPEGVNPAPLAQWAPKVSDEMTIEIYPSIYLVESHDICWKCGHATPVYSVAAGRVKDIDWSRPSSHFVVLDYIANMPGALAEAFHGIETYFLDFTKTTESWYYVNHCEKCYSVIGDHFMHREPHGAFSPMYDYECEHITLINLDINTTLSLDAGYHMDSDGGVIHRFAKTKKYDEWKNAQSNSN